MQSLSKRLADRKEEILKITREKGSWAGMCHAGVSDYIAWRKWLARPDVANNPDVGLCATNPDDPRTDSELLRAKTNCAFSKLLDALDLIAEGEARKLKAERELKVRLWKYLEAKRRIELKLHEVTG